MDWVLSGDTKPTRTTRHTPNKRTTQATTGLGDGRNHLKGGTWCSTKPKNNKSAGLDGIQAELLKQGGIALLTQLLNPCWRQADVPEDLKIGRNIQNTKERSLLSILTSTYRPSLPSSTYRPSLYWKHIGQHKCSPSTSVIGQILGLTPWCIRSYSTVFFHVILDLPLFCCFLAPSPLPALESGCFPCSLHVQASAFFVLGSPPASAVLSFLLPALRMHYVLYRSWSLSLYHSFLLCWHQCSL